MTVLHTDAVIADTETDSGIIDVRDRVIVGVHMPADWDAADLSLYCAVDPADTFVPMYDAAGVQLTLTVAADQFIAIAPDATRGVNYVQLVASAAQSPARTFRVATQQDDRA